MDVFRKEIIYIIDDTNYIEPDISVISDCVKLDKKGCYGVSDWIIKIVSHAFWKYKAILLKMGIAFIV